MTRTNPFTARVWLDWPILLILALAAVLRVRGIGHDSLWGDEALTILLAKMSIPELIKNLIWFEQIPPVQRGFFASTDWLSRPHSSCWQPSSKSCSAVVGV